MRSFLLVPLLFISIAALCQTEDFPDYRSKKDFFARQREKDLRSDLASFTMGGLDESMGKTALKTIPMKEYKDNYLSFEGDGIKVSIKTAPFQEGKHKLMYYDEKHLVRIDNKPYYGIYGKLPKVQIESVIVTINQDTVAIPAIAYADIYDLGFAYKDASGVQRSQNRVYISADKRTFYIYLLDRNAGGTEVTWIIQDKKYLKRVLDFGFTTK